MLRTYSLMFMTRPASRPPRITRATLILPITDSPLVLAIGRKERRTSGFYAPRPSDTGSGRSRRLGCLLVVKGSAGIDARGAARREGARRERDTGDDERRGRQRQRIDGADAEQHARKDLRDADRCRETDHGADHDGPHRSLEHQRDDAARTRAERHANPDLARSAANGVGDDAVDADGGEDQCESPEGGRERARETRQAAPQIEVGLQRIYADDESRIELAGNVANAARSRGEAHIALGQQLKPRLAVRRGRQVGVDRRHLADALDLRVPRDAYDLSRDGF